MTFLSASWRFLTKVPGWVYTALAVLLSLLLLGKVQRLNQVVKTAQKARKIEKERQEAEQENEENRQNAHKVLDKEEEEVRTNAETEAEKIGTSSPHELVDTINDVFS